MNPRRPGKENFPTDGKAPPPDAVVADYDDSTLPTINIHYDFRPKDWVQEAFKANTTAKLRSRLRGATRQYYKDRENTIKSMLNQNQEIQQLELQALHDVVAARARLGGLVLPDSLPDYIASGSILGTSRMAEKDAILEDKWKKSASWADGKVTDNFWYPYDVGLSGADFWDNMADQSVSE